MAPRSPTGAGLCSGFLSDLQAGVHYAFGFLPIRNILLLLAVVSLCGMLTRLLMPVFAKDILRGGAQTLGILMGQHWRWSTGWDDLLGGAQLGVGLGKRIPLAAACFGVGLIGFLVFRQMLLSLPLIAVADSDDGEYGVFQYHPPDHRRRG